MTDLIDHVIAIHIRTRPETKMHYNQDPLGLMMMPEMVIILIQFYLWVINLYYMEGSGVLYSKMIKNALAWGWGGGG